MTFYDRDDIFSQRTSKRDMNIQTQMTFESKDEILRQRGHFKTDKIY